MCYFGCGGTMSAFPEGINIAPLINQDFIDLSGCDIPALPISDEALDIINKAISGELFINPVQNALNAVGAEVGKIITEVDNAVGSVFMTLDGTQLGTPIPGVDLSLFGGENPTAAQFITSLSDRVTNTANFMQEQSDILSGVSLTKDGFDQNGGVSDMPGISAIQSLAAGFNNTVNSLSNTDELLDNYSQFFGSVLGPGTDLTNGINAALEGDFRTALNLLPRDSNGNINFLNASTQNLQDLVDAYDSVMVAKNAVEELINNERALVLAATEYLVKATFGFSILAMLADPCFGKIVADKVFNI